MSKEKYKNKEKDKRVNTKHISVMGFVWTYFILAVMNAGQVMIYTSFF